MTSPKTRSTASWRAGLLSRPKSDAHEFPAAPIRGELLGPDKLANRARSLARSQRLIQRLTGWRGAPLLRRLEETHEIIEHSHARLAAAAATGVDVGPAAEWLLDNMYVVQEHMREVRESLPKGYYRELPELANGHLAGYPRVYEIATTLIAHTEGRVDLEDIERFVAEFQENAFLTLGELWAVPAMLRLGLIENVRRMTLRAVQGLDQTEEADRWARRIHLAAGEGGELLGAALNDFVANHPPLTAVFVTHFLQQMRLEGGGFTPLTWLQQWLAEDGMSAELAATQSRQRAALTQVGMANSITSLRAVALQDWKGFVERQSVTEAALRQDPSGFYARMTFATRDRYRHVVEAMAKRTRLAEEVVARHAVALARESAERHAGVLDDRAAFRTTHVGYYLVDEGRAELERAIRFRPKVNERIYRALIGAPNLVFVGGIVAGTAATMGLVLSATRPESTAMWIVLALVAFIPATAVASSLVNILITSWLRPRLLPRLEFGEPPELPAEYCTAVVVPTLFDDVSDVTQALEHLEAQFLANRAPKLFFAILSDVADAPEETRPQDDAIIAAAVQGIIQLNERYADDRPDGDVFFLFHRPRKWNAREDVWMGWERKRGKLADFNRFLQTGDRSAWSVITGDPEMVRRARYVLTIDADTVIPPDAALRLVGTIAHPLNQAVYDPEHARVVKGYGIIQPRVNVLLPSAFRSRFAAIHSGHPGVDPYTTAVSDAYQDLYGEGSFTGKGIYEVEIFERATRGRFPENTLLSHDLIEGNYARAALATDIELYDEYPSRYLSFARRKDRWTRGDWQLLEWVGPRVPGPDGPERNRLSLLSRWKIADNMRRSMVEITQVLLLVVGWAVMPTTALAWRWSFVGLAMIAAPWVFAFLVAVVGPPLDKSWRAYYRAVAEDAKSSAMQLVLALAFLPHQAWSSADAIVRTLWRMFVSKRKLLQWRTAMQTEQGTSSTAGAAWRAMWPAVAIAAAAALVAEHLAPALPYIIPWALSPAIATALNGPPVRRQRPLSRAQRTATLRYALLHWRFFERFVTSDTQWLAPDNHQEVPEPITALRTSPTNIGLQLMSIMSAHDLGFITLAMMVTRLEQVFDALARMRRLHGHFYNWYSLHDLEVLQPPYISTVDSGNLSGHLLAVAQGCLHLCDRPAASTDSRTREALYAAVSLVGQRLRETPLIEQALGSSLAGAKEELRIARRVLTPDTSPSGWLNDAVNALMRTRAAMATATPSTPVSDATDLIVWSLNRAAAHRTDDNFTAALGTRLEKIATIARRYATSMDFGFLLDEKRKLFSIGYSEATHSYDASSYDLLASEARLASLIAIAKNDAPPEHWFRLGRTLVHAAGETALVSWSGSMFEYLMPLLVVRSFPDTVMYQSYHGSVRRQIAYGAEHGVPWGVSESAYNMRDRHLIYQYRAFGVPDLALKRGLARDLVIAPYASALAMMVDPDRALDNLSIIAQQGMLGPYGFRDAMDYTRPNPGHRFAPVRTYMAHHIGMSLVAFTNALTDQVWHHRFHSEALVRSVELLLHERIPRRLVFREPPSTSVDEALPNPDLERPAVREIDTPHTPQPVIALLGSLPYTIMVSNSGAGYSRYEQLAVTRWRADGTRDDTGQFCYVRDLGSGRVWSAAHQPVCAAADYYRVLFATDRVTTTRVDAGIETRTEIAVVTGDAAEVRRITLTNQGDTPRDIELTSYGEIVIGPPDADRAHPAFANLFVETEWHAWCAAITATRRPRSGSEQPLWLVHVVDNGRERVGPVTCETDRARFIGRGRSRRSPLALDQDGPLSGTTGAVLDPVFALRTRVHLEAGQCATVAFTTIVATSRERAFELADRYHHPHSAQRALDMAWTGAQIELRELNISAAETAVYQELAGHLLFADSSLRMPADEIVRNEGSQPLLWANGISGDWPILLATVETPEGLPTIRQLLAAHHYWRRRGLRVDLVILNASPPSYLADLNDRITELVLGSSETGEMDRPGGIFVRRRELLDDASLLMLRATARVHIECDGRPIGKILAVLTTPKDEGEFGDEQFLTPERLLPARSAGRATPAAVRIFRRIRDVITDEGWTQEPEGSTTEVTPHEKPPVQASPSAAQSSAELAISLDKLPPLAADNGFGGLTDGDAYEIRLRDGRLPPAAWSNVIATPRVGFLVTERGGGCTWVENSQFFRLTPWQNDPVSDPPSEVIYLRDEESGELWSATAAPVAHDTPYIVRHDAGSTTCEHAHAGISTHLTLGVSEQDTVKLSLLRVTNSGTTPRRISVTSFLEWTLGVLREHAQHQVHTSFAAEQGAVLARNTFNPQFAEWVAFCAMSEPVTSHTADRREFIGRNGTLEDPAGMRSEPLSGATGAVLDPCAALRCILQLAPGESRDVVIALGAARSDAAARQLAGRYRDVALGKRELAGSADAWNRRLGVVRVKTPDPLFDTLVNRWSLYQALACRMWARTALYQSSGAYGFRDQLQDVMAFVYAEPGVAREHILRAASRQFVEGDVQHWWHEPAGRGVRTRISDDLIWLPYVVHHYVAVTGDTGVLDEQVPFLTMRPLEPHEEEVYDLPQVADEHASVYEHCLRALRRASTVGVHGLPLMGTGDWNDGMNRVGVEGRGESVWLAWFLISTLRSFAEHVDARGETAVASELRGHADGYASSIEANAWDGAWYRRAYFDDGTPLGSASSDECKIDSIAQSWSIISGAGPAERRTTAMASARKHLVDEDARLIKLLTPPFDKTPNDPGYIKGYLPGVRENGAQYTHAALWAVLAMAMEGDGDLTFAHYQMINPFTHARTPDEVETYKVEPYVVAADVYTAKGHLGRGGWTWYTGSASWMYRVGLEAILGFTKRGNALVIKPCVPRAWPELGIEYRFGKSVYAITVTDPSLVGTKGAEIRIDGQIIDGDTIPLVDDGARRVVAIRPRS